MLSLIAIAGTLAASVAAQSSSTRAEPSPAAAGPIPLASMRFTYPNLPYKIDTDATGRGPQFGFNQCNSTTANQLSNCQTGFINSISDFCLWGPPNPNSVVGDTEGEAVAWCTNASHGTRVIPAGALTGVQFMRTPAYVQVTGFIKQDLINMQADDGGGEMDPHGADLRGNPLGGLVFSNAWGAGGNQYTQVIEWHNFMGSGEFCFKACDPSGPDAAKFCEHVFDRIGCHYNAPASYVDGVFESCLGDNQDFPGIYTGADGITTRFQQPAESLGPISSMPYDPKIPASSSCTPYQSAQIYTGQPTVAAPSTSAAPTSMASTTAAPRPLGAVPRSSSAAASASAGTNAGSASYGSVNLGGIVVVALGALVGAVIVL